MFSRHRLLRVFQLCCAIAAALLAFFGPAPSRAVASQRYQSFTLSVVGERERGDGSWEGVDLLSSPDQSVERAQLQLRVLRPSRVYVDVLEEGGPRRLYPGVHEPNVLRPGALYTLPGPTAFYEVRGQPTLRVTLQPLDDAAAPPEPAVRVGGSATVTGVLTDGAEVEVTEVPFTGP